MNATNMVQGNLALKLDAPATPAFSVVKGGRAGYMTVSLRHRVLRSLLSAPLQFL